MREGFPRVEAAGIAASVSPPVYDHGLAQGWPIILSEGPYLVLDLDERAGKVVQETNPPNKDQRLIKNSLPTSRLGVRLG